MLSAHTRKQNRIVICALETYSTIGGLQSFNRRVFKNVALRTVERKEPSALVVLSADRDAELPVIDGLEFAAPKNQLRFLASALWASLFELACC
jgi:hypothetical protein